MARADALLRTGTDPQAALAWAGEAVASVVARYDLLRPGERVLVALSGGRDSTALAVLLHRLGYNAALGHVDHGMRHGSGRDAAHCERLAGMLGLPFRCVRLAQAPPDEAAARGARYQALEAMAARLGASSIATGHTLDDAAETVAMRLGIPPRRGNVVRPLLGLRRADTEAVCRAAGLDWVDDPTNLDEQHLRNRLRRRAMPALGEPLVRSLAAVGTARAARGQARREAALGGPLLRRRPGGTEIDRSGLLALPAHAARVLVRTALELAGAGTPERLVRDVLTKVVPATGAGLDVGSGLRAWAEPDRVVIGTGPARVRLPEVPLAVPGRTPAPAWGLDVVAEVLAAQEITSFPSGALEAVVDGSAASGLVLRQRRPGDRFVPLGASGTTKLQDLFVNRKVPRGERDRVPVLASGDEIVWVAGHRIADRWKVTPRSNSVLKLRIVPCP